MLASIDLGLAGYEREQGENLRRQALDRMSALPGVERAAFANSLPLSSDLSTSSIYVDDDTTPATSELPSATKYEVSPGFFSALKTRMVAGRDFEWSDDADAPHVAVVNEAFVQQILRTPEGVGQRFRFGRRGAPIAIVGVVETGKYQTLTERDTPAVFASILQDYNSNTVFLVRSALPTAGIADELRGIVAAIDPAMPVSGVETAEEMLGGVLLPMRVAASALGAFGVLAVMLAITGIHGLVAYAVTRRRREIAMRVAVGASQLRILGLIAARVTALVAVGVLAGLLLVVAARPALQSVIYGASPTDFTTIALAASILALVGVTACWMPVRSALRVDPRTVLSE